MRKYKRIEKIISLIKTDESVLDVGTDHALVPILLLRNNITDKITATDINIEPLKIAKENLKEHGFLEKVKIVLTDGFDNLNINDFNVIVIAGMGGQTISKILKSKSFNGRYIIHSTTDIPLVRKTISENGMTIINEYLITEGKIYNILIQVISGEQKLSDKELFMGPLLMNDPNTKEYYKFCLNNMEKNALLSKNTEYRIKERNWLKEAIWNENI